MCWGCTGVLCVLFSVVLCCVLFCVRSVCVLCWGVYVLFCMLHICVFLFSVHVYMFAGVYVCLCVCVLCANCVYLYCWGAAYMCILYSMQVHIVVHGMQIYVCVIAYVCAYRCVGCSVEVCRTQSDTPHVGCLCGHMVRIIKYKKTQPLIKLKSLWFSTFHLSLKILLF